MPLPAASFSVIWPRYLGLRRHACVFPFMVIFMRENLAVPYAAESMPSEALSQPPPLPQAVPSYAQVAALSDVRTAQQQVGRRKCGGRAGRGRE